MWARIARRLANTIRLLKLPAKVKTALVEKKISAGHARCLLACSSTEEQIAALDINLKKRFKCPGNGTINTKHKKTAGE